MSLIALSQQKYLSLIHTRYIINYSFITFTDPHGRFPQVIDRDSPFVAAFDIWRRDTPGILGSNNPTQAHASRVPAQSAGPLQELPRPQVQSGSRPQGQPGTKPQGERTQLPQRPAVNPGSQRPGSSRQPPIEEENQPPRRK